MTPMATHRLDVRHSSTFDADTDRLRQVCFPGTYPSGSSRDAYDARSTHISVRMGGTLAGGARLIPRPTDFFRDTYGGRIKVPDSPDAAYLGRVMVSPDYRGHDVFELLLAEALLLAVDMGYATVFGGARSSRKFLPLLDELGFEPYGTPQMGSYPDHTESSSPVQSIVVTTQGRRRAWAHRKEQVLSRLGAAGYPIGCYGSPTDG
jgi:GNAT superfamily N-acetyltransferase